MSSFAVSYFLQHLVVLVHTGRPKSVGIGEALTKAVDLGGGISVPGVQLATLVVTGILLLALVLFLKKTPLGIQMRAAAENFEMARLLGIPANRVISMAFMISGLLAGAAALLMVVQTGTLDIRMGLMPVVYGFFATVIGGMGSLPGAALGVASGEVCSACCCKPTCRSSCDRFATLASLPSSSSFCWSGHRG
ncbi:MAG: hypothetical protein U5L11_16595 [Arhodomonas sp.]|nr:hypothetical protein [Arhodomonas sp.]